MIKTTAPGKTPSPAEQAKPHAAVGKEAGKSPTAVFVSAALDMSWRLAIVVLMPIIGGFELDTRLDTTPFLTIVGFFLAMGGMTLVLWRMLQSLSSTPVNKQGHRT